MDAEPPSGGIAITPLIAQIKLQKMGGSQQIMSLGSQRG
jgi:hypothetical protein